MKYAKFLLFGSLLVFFLFSCRDKCKDVNCNNGNCEEGICICEEGYSGEFCDFKLSQKFAGEWAGPFTCVDQSQDVLIHILDFADDPKKISLSTVGLGVVYNGFEFNLDDKSLSATINDNYDGFNIEPQSETIDVPDNPGISISIYGSGELSDNDELSVQIHINNIDFGLSIDCIGTATKK